MIYTPTTTKTILTANNTSASSSFAGWPNADAKAGDVSHVAADMPQMKLVHRCDWWGYGSHPDIGIKSNDPAYCAKTAADMKARGLDGCILDWYGPTSNEEKSLAALKPELEKQGLKFAICIDGGSAAFKTQDDDTAALNSIFDYINTKYFSSPAYVKQNGRPVVLFFGPPTCDWAKVRAHIQTLSGGNPLLFFRWEIGYGTHPEADGFFGWTHCNEAWVTAVKAKGKQVMLGVNGGFNSSIKVAPVNCTWGSGTIIAQEGGMHLQNQIAVGKAHPEIAIAQFNTWNDYQEGSEIETGLNSGASITLGMTNGVLSWSDPGAAFDHTELYISDDGERMMPLAISHGVTSVDLTGYGVPAGKWTFYVFGVAKFGVDDVLSNRLAATETMQWTVSA